MTARDFATWRAWFDLEPRGDERADYHAAFIVSQLLAAKMGDKAPSAFECLESLRCMWAERSEVERVKARRKVRKKKRIQRQFAQAGEQARITEECQRIEQQLKAARTKPSKNGQQ